MVDNLADQFKQSLKPANDLANVGVKTFEQLAGQHNALFTGMLDAGLEYTQSLSVSGGVFGLMKAQKEWFDGVQGKMVTAVNEAAAVLASAQEQTTEILGEAMADAPMPPGP